MLLHFNPHHISAHATGAKGAQKAHIPISTDSPYAGCQQSSRSELDEAHRGTTIKRPHHFTPDSKSALCFKHYPHFARSPSRRYLCVCLLVPPRWALALARCDSLLQALRLCWAQPFTPPSLHLSSGTSAVGVSPCTMWPFDRSMVALMGASPLAATCTYVSRGLRAGR